MVDNPVDKGGHEHRLLTIGHTKSTTLKSERKKYSLGLTAAARTTRFSLFCASGYHANRPLAHRSEPQDHHELH